VIALAILLAGAVRWRALAAEAPADPLWRSAVTLAAANTRWVPGLLDVRIEVLDNDGRAKNVSELRVRRRPGPKGEVVEEIERAIEDGRDVTMSEREKQRKRQAQASAKGAAKRKQNPNSAEDDDDADVDVKVNVAQCFLPAAQPLVSAQRTGEKRTIEGRPCVAFQFTCRRGSKGTMRGTAWLDEADGTPREMSYTSDPLPKHVKRMLTTVHYEHTADGAWRPTVITLDGSAAFLFIKKKLHVTATASEWWKKPATG
jgi:hypothetical protein